MISTLTNCRFNPPHRTNGRVWVSATDTMNLRQYDAIVRKGQLTKTQDGAGFWFTAA